MISKTNSAVLVGIDAYHVEIEGNPTFAGEEQRTVIVGLPDTTVRESRDRINSAIFSCGYKAPRGLTVINLAPATLRKEGSGFDLPIALELLAATNVFPAQLLKSAMILGELALDGSLRPVRGVLSAALLARKIKDIGMLIVPADNASEAAVVASELKVYPVHNMREAVAALTGEIAPLAPDTSCIYCEPDWNGIPDFADVKGQNAAKRALEIAAAGGHNVIFIGPPGSGKSMLAQRMPGILPPMTEEETLETSRIHSALGLLPAGMPLLRKRPFRSPHHTVSDAGLLGGGVNPQPGEISLAHNGVLFLDELPEFKRNVLEVMRQPMEDGVVTVSRAAGSFTFPCRFLLIAAMNPCPCGHLGDRLHRCTCRAQQIQQYRARISGPLLDRIDLHVRVDALTENELTGCPGGESSATIRARCIKAREIQHARFGKDSPVRCNAMMTPPQINQCCQLDPSIRGLIQHAIAEFGLSARAYDRILRVARTIADLAGSEQIRREHLFEAIGYRSLDRRN